MKVQELIHALEVGPGVRRLRWVVALLLGVMLTAWFYLQEFQNFRAPEAMEAAQLARNLANGEGYITKCIRPLTIHLVTVRQGIESRLARQPHPDLTNPPVYPILLAGLMKVLPFRYETGPQFWRYQPEVLIAFFNQALFFLTLGLTYRLARRLFDPAVAITTALVLLGSDILWRFSVSGQSTNLLLLLFVGLLTALTAAEAGARDATKGTRWVVRQSILLGALVGVGALTRYSFAWLLLPVVACCGAWFKTRRWLACGVIAATFLVLVAPWLTRNYQVSGTLFGVPGFAVHQDTEPFPGTRLERSLDPDLAQIEARDYVRKISKRLAESILDDVPRLGGAGLIAAFFFVSLFLRFNNPALGRLRLFVLLSLVLLLVVQAGGYTHLSKDVPLVNSENLLVLLLPAAALFGTALFFVLLDQLALAIEEMRYLLTAVFVLMTSSQLISDLLPPRTFPLAYPPYLPPWIQETSGFLQSGELMMSDMPWAVAWYGNRSCVWTTLDAGRTYFRVNDEQQQISALYLTPLTTDARFLTQTVQSKEYVWSQFALEVLLQTNVPALFPLRHARQKYLPDQLLLCDRPRWQEPRPKP